MFDVGTEVINRYQEKREKKERKCVGTENTRNDKKTGKQV